MEALRRFVLLVLRPAAEWDVIAGERTSVDALIRRVVLPLSLGAPITSRLWWPPSRQQAW